MYAVSGDRLYALASDHGSVWQWSGNGTDWIKIGGPQADMIAASS